VSDIHSTKNHGVGKRAQSNLGHPETGTRTGQKVQPAQQKVARLPHPLYRFKRSERKLDSSIFITEGDSAIGIHHQGPQREQPGGVQLERETIEYATG
jgi:DNA gyrase/topoisomerase IV subunit B